MTDAALPRDLREDASARDAVRIAVCADDFGLDPSVNAGAMMLADMQRVSAIACMVGAPFWRRDAPLVRGLDPQRVEAGLHLDLTEHPLDARMRRSLAEWVLRSHAGALDRRGLRREIEAQLDAFAADMGRPPAFVDGHQYVHQLPGVRDVLVEALETRGLRPWLRSTRRPPGLRSRKARLIEVLGAAGLTRQARAHGLRQNLRLLGIYGFDGDRGSYLQALRQWLALAGSGDLLVCHPAAGMTASAPLAAARQREFDALSGGAFGSFLARANVHIVPLQAAIA
jgi:predicted glycoside hydrolase/deacetylase ChbG (UPF0249 family)